jgi:small subunit ribosomal protein S3
MGQKTHPLGFRLGITQEHKSTWHSRFTNYADTLKEDDKIRTYLNSIAKVNGISNVQINRDLKTETIEIKIETGKPEILIGKNGVALDKLVINIQKLLPLKSKLRVEAVEVKKVDLNASLLGDLVVDQLEKRVAFRRAIREALLRAQKQNVKGIKIQVSGRLNGAEMARTEWIREGRVPLQTLRADIDYATKEANTIYGILGIKIWLFKGEILIK